jgi:ELWxxDGT repeat protein
MKFKKITLILALLCTVVTLTEVKAQNPYLVKDIILSGSTVSSTPANLTNVNGVLYFAATDPLNGIELWKSDGTSGGTVMVKNINSGGSNSSPANLTNVNGVLYFAATNGTNGIELWKSDGTSGGTVLVKDIRSGNGNSSPANLTNVNGVLYFSATDGTTNAIELWKSDGTDAGTVMVKNINTVSNGNSSPSNLTNVNGVLYFAATNGTTNGIELWKSDGTNAGTVLVKDIRSGSGNSSPANLTNVNGVLYFSATDGTTNAIELWKSDGTSGGTVMVKNINTVSNGSSSPASLTNVNGVLYFSATDGTNGVELWKSDGTSGGTVMVKNINSGGSNSSPANLTNVNGVLYFSATGGTNGVELWKSDGTDAGTVLVKDIRSGSSSSSPASLTNVNGVLYFSAFDDTNGRELWKSDGTDAGTVLVKDINAGSGSSSPASLTNVNGVLYFSATDGTNGIELWKSDGTNAGTVLVKDINAGSGNSSPVNLTNVNGVLYFSADDGTNGVELWKSDGTDAGTVLVKDINAGSGSSSPANLTNVNGVLYFSANNGSDGVELWKSDGTAAGTIQVKNIAFFSNSSNPANLTNINGVLYFAATDATTNAIELWKSDGTDVGTVMVKNINAVSNGNSNPTSLTDVNGVLYFSANDGINGTELWKSDGTDAGTVLIKDIWTGSGNSSNTGNLTNVNGVLYFSAFDLTNGYELWKSDGTSAGTVLVKDISTGNGSSTPANLTNVNGVLYFSAFDDTNGIELWKSDGTSAGTVLVKDISTGTTSSSPTNLTNVNGVLYFSAFDLTNGRELWKSDGTDAGTVLRKDINAGSANSSPASLTNVNGVLYFSANDGTNGVGLWKSDGSAAGTVVVKDINAGSGAASSPASLTNVNGVLFFSASSSNNNFYYGTELMALGNCTTANNTLPNLTTAVAPYNSLYYNQQQQTSPTTLTCHCDVFNNLISSVDATGTFPIAGTINSKAWIEATQPSNPNAIFVKRHFEITPATNASTATGMVTLYFTQQDFDDFNAVSTVDLPTGTADATGKANLLIEKRSGVSNDGSGLPQSYTGTTETIDPVDTDIVWNSTANRWEVSFNTTGFSGFFVKTAPILITTWNGSTWTNGNPTSTYDASIVSSIVPSASFTCQHLSISYGVALTTTGITATINGNIINNGNGIAGTGDLIIAANCTLSGNAVSFNGTLTVNSGATLTTAGLLTLASNATNTARVANSAGSISGNVTVERYLPAKRAWRLLTAPLGGENTSVYTAWQNGGNVLANTGVGLWHPSGGTGLVTGGVSSNLRTFDVTNNAWVPVTSTQTTNLFTNAGSAANNAFLIFPTGPYGGENMLIGSAITTLKATGSLQTGTQTFSIPDAAFSNSEKIQLIGNPYASPVDFNLLTRTNVTKRFWAWDPQLSGVGGYVLVSDLDDDNTYTVTPGGSSQTQHIQSGQAFFVEVNNTGASLVFNEDDKSTSNINTVFRTGTGTERLSVDMINPNDGLVIDGILAEYNNNFSNGVAAEDGQKLFRSNENFYLTRNTKPLMLEGRKLIDNNDTLFLTLSGMRIQDYRFAINGSNFANDANLSAYLKDKFLGTETAINLSGTTEYNFAVTADNNSKAADRFMVVFRSNASLPVTLTNVKAYQQNSGINVEWNTQSESGMLHYEVEKSTNGSNFAKVNTTAAKSGAANTYNYFDATPNNGANYYRIKAISLNGEVKYSSIVVVRLNSKSSNITLYPNPVKGSTIQLQVSNVEKGNYSVTLFNQLGQQVMNKTINHIGGSSNQTVELGILASGVYELRLSNGTTVITQKLIKE